MWKAFHIGPDGDLLTSVMVTSVKRGVWVKADNVGEFIYRGYPAGFHGHVRKEDAKEWLHDVVLRVRYRGGHTQGIQDGAKVIVADEIFIPAAKGK